MRLTRTGSPPVRPHEPTADPDSTARTDETRSDRTPSPTSPVRDAASSAKTPAASRNSARCYAHEVPTS